MDDYFIFHSVNRWLPLTANWIHEQTKIWPQQQQLVLADQLVEPIPESPEVQFRNAFHPSMFQRMQTKVLASKNDLFRSIQISRKSAERKVLISHFGNRGYADLGLKVDKHIVRFYGYDIHRLPAENPEWLVKYAQLFHQTQEFWVEGPFMKKQLTELGCMEEKIKVLPLGTDMQNVQPKIRKPESNQFNLLLAGAFKEKKGIVDALECCKLLITAGFDIRIHLVGDEINATTEDRKYAQMVRELTKDPIFKNRIKHYGLMSRMGLLEIANKCDLGLLPSRWAANRDCEGGYPVLFLDVMATGLPILSTNHCDIPFIINKENGWLCQENDVYALAQKLTELLQNPGEIELKSKNVMANIKNNFSWESLKPHYETALND